MSKDDDLRQAVVAELGWEPSVVAAHIGVTANAGVVTLTGRVDTLAQKIAAEAAARRVKGVMGVAEEIEIRLPSGAARSDEALAAAVLGRIAWDVSVPEGAVQVQVEDGWITLTGQLDWHYQRQAVEHDVHGMAGVIGISNETTIKPASDADDLKKGDIKAGIMHALNRSWLDDPDGLTVTMDGGTVRLTGRVKSPHDRDLAAGVAWAALGTTAVENDISVVW